MSRVEGVSVAVGGGQVGVVEGVVGEFGQGVVAVVEGRSVVEVIVSLRKHELQSVVGVVCSGVEASLGVCGKNWTASRGQMSVGHDSEEEDLLDRVLAPVRP